MTTRKTRTTKSDEPTIAFAFAEYPAARRRLQDERRKRDLDLAASVGIEVGARREAAMRKDREGRVWDRGFIVGIVFACVFLFVGLYGARIASGATRPAQPPKHWVKTALKIGACEQPRRYADGKRRYGFAAIAWHQTHNYSFQGGLGMTNLLWDLHKRRGQPEDMHQATPMEQIWASWRFYKWAEKTYPGYGYTGWDCSATIGFFGFRRDGSWK